MVKVQYPGVDSSVDSDLAQLKLALRASGILKVKRKALDAVFGELRDRLHEELDYCNEADNVRLFREFHAKHAFVAVPDVVGERSAKRVLTLTYEPGDTLYETARYPQEVRNQIGANLYKVSISQICELQALQSDPNPANFAFREDGTIVLYDFGCVKKLDPAIVSAYARTILAAMEDDFVAVDKGLIDIGVRIPDGPVIEPSYYKEWKELLFEPFVATEPYNYGEAKVHEEVVKRIPGILRRLDSFQPNVHGLFIDRVARGHYENLRELHATGTFYDILEPYLKAAVAAA